VSCAERGWVPGVSLPVSVEVWDGFRKGGTAMLCAMIAPASPNSFFLQEWVGNIFEKRARSVTKQLYGEGALLHIFVVD
jgi:hypothetical protein